MKEKRNGSTEDKVKPNHSVANRASKSNSFVNTLETLSNDD